MRHSCSTARRRLMMCSALLALGLASAAPIAAQAQSQIAPTTPQPPEPPMPAAAPAPNPLGEVTVESARQDPLRNMDPKKRAEFDAEVAKQEAFRKYRSSSPPTTADSKGVSDPNEMSQDFPGLRSYAPAN